MSIKPKYQQDYEETMEGMWWGVAVFIGAMYFLVNYSLSFYLYFYYLIIYLIVKQSVMGLHCLFLFYLVLA